MARRKRELCERCREWVTLLYSSGTIVYREADKSYVAERICLECLRLAEQSDAEEAANMLHNELVEDCEREE